MTKTDTADAPAPSKSRPARAVTLATTLLRGFISPGSDATAAELRAAHADAEARRDDAAARLAELEAARGEILLAGDAAAAASHEAALREARDDADRMGAVVAALVPRVAAAEAAEQDAALRAVAADAEAVAVAALADVQGYEAAGRELFATAARVNERAREVRAANATLRAAGRADLVVTPALRRHWPHAGGDTLDYLAVAGPRRVARDGRSFAEDVAGPRAGGQPR